MPIDFRPDQSAVGSGRIAFEPEMPLADRIAFEPDPPEPSLLERAFTPIQPVAGLARAASEGLTTPREGRGQIEAMARGFAGGALEGAASMVTPGDIALTLLGGPVGRAGGRALRRIRGVRRIEQGLVPRMPTERQLPAQTATAADAERRAQAVARTELQEAADVAAGRQFGAQIPTPTLPTGRVTQRPSLEDVLVEALEKTRQPEAPTRVSLQPPPFGPTPTPAQPRVSFPVGRVAPASPLTRVPQVEQGPLPVRFQDARQQFIREGVEQATMTPVEQRRFLGAEKATRSRAEADALRAAMGPGTKRVPLEKELRELDRRFEQLINDPRGAARVETLVSAGVGAVAGGTIGAQTAPEDSPAVDRFTRAISGALLGAVAGAAAPAAVSGAGRLARRGGRDLGRRVLEQTEALDTANLLAGPAAIRASLGALGGIASAIAERAAMGPQGREQAQAMWRFLSHEGPRIYRQALMSPKGAQAVQSARAASGRNLPRNRVVDVVLAPFRAADSVAVETLRRGGYTPDEAMNLLLTGKPTSEYGQQALRLMQHNFVTRFLAKFPRVRIQALERGLEFSPARRAVNVRTVKGLRPLDPRQARVREAIGVGAFLGGAGVGTAFDPSLGTAATLAAAAGPASLPAGLGLATGRAIRGGSELAQELTKELAFSVPGVRDADIRRILTGERFTPLRSARRFLGD